MQAKNRTKVKNPRAQTIGKLGGKARMKSLTHSERFELASKAGRTRAKNLSARRRKQIAKLAVAARELKRAERKARHGR